jgi:hypothetical protein
VEQPRGDSREELLAPRATALGGVDVALTDDASAAPRNPALLARLWRHEAAASFGGPGRADFTHVGLARWSAHGFAAGVFARRTSSLVVRTADSRLDAELTETGVQVARRIGRGLALGAGLTATRLTLVGEGARTVDGGPASGRRRRLDARRRVVRDGVRGLALDRRRSPAHWDDVRGYAHGDT